MSNVTNTDPVVTESKLTEFYEDIKPFLGCPAYVTQEGDAEYYSTDEKVIGRWVDNKPLYKKTYFYQGTLATNSEIVIADVSGLNIERFVRGYGTSKEPNWGSIALPELEYRISVRENNKLYVSVGSSSMQNAYTYISIEYTKTTDSAVTTVEVKPTHYSTDEQVVGTWIDGKPIYQKTINCGAGPTASGNKEIPHGITNLGTTVKIEGIGIIPGNDWIYPVPFSSPTDLSAGITVWANSTNIVLQARQNRSNSNIYITISYTKTTD